MYIAIISQHQSYICLAASDVPNGSDIVFDSDDIVLDSDIAYAVIFALRASCGFTLASAESRNITLTKSKYNFSPTAKNITVCNANDITKIARCLNRRAIFLIRMFLV